MSAATAVPSPPGENESRDRALALLGDGGGVVVGDRIKVTLEVEAVLQKA